MEPRFLKTRSALRALAFSGARKPTPRRLTGRKKRGYLSKKKKKKGYNILVITRLSIKCQQGSCGPIFLIGRLPNTPALQRRIVKCSLMHLWLQNYAVITQNSLLVIPIPLNLVQELIRSAPCSHDPLWPYGQ